MTESDFVGPSLAVGRTFDGAPLTPGVNVDRVDVEAGISLAARFGYDGPLYQMVVEYALMRHRRGEEDGAQRTALHYGIDLTSWYAILAAARSHAEAAIDPGPPSVRQLKVRLEVEQHAEVIVEWRDVDEPTREKVRAAALEVIASDDWVTDLGNETWEDV